VAAALEARDGAPPVELLAYHHRCGGSAEKAMHYLTLAGILARERGAHAAAADHYQEAVGLLDGLGRACDAARLREQLGMVLQVSARYEQALAVLDEARSAFDALGDYEGAWRVLAQAGRIHGLAMRPAQGLAHLSAVRAVVDADTASPGRAALVAALAWLLLAGGRPADSVAAAERGAAMARALGDERLLADVTATRGVALGGLGEIDRAIEALEETRILAEQLGERTTLVRALNQVGGLYAKIGQFDRAVACFEATRALAERSGEPRAMEIAFGQLGAILFLRGEWGAAHARFEQALAIFTAIGWTISSFVELLGLARLHLALGEPEEACRFLDIIESGPGHPQGGGDKLEARMLRGEGALLAGDVSTALAHLLPLLDEVHGEPPLHTMVAWAQAESGRLDAAAVNAGEAIALARGRRDGPILVEALEVQALVLIRQGRWAEADAALAEGLALACHLPYPYAEARILYQEGMLHSARGSPDEARAALDAALAIFRRLGAHPYIERTERALAAQALLSLPTGPNEGSAGHRRRWSHPA
jgi:tetratricopeptide (TPR) repeat protein